MVTKDYEFTCCNSLSGSQKLNIDQPFEQMHFIEEVGLMFEMVGMPRMSGRIFGWLLISDPAQQSNAALAEVLQASKGSISTMTRFLIQLGLIERVSLPGDRRDYFQIKDHAWSQLTKQRLVQIGAFRQLAERGLELLKQAPPQHRRRLQEMRDIHDFWERELPLLDQRWDHEQEKRRLHENF
ncbi:MarR family transcriptional regulator [Phormidium tenue FACHB-886]|nr:MarR family transcriptional regulator [Phormidium tenue FACHB-886]